MPSLCSIHTLPSIFQQGQVKELARARHRPHSPAVRRDETLSCGMGWLAGTPNGVPIVWHGGDLAAGYHADTVLLPSVGSGPWGIVVLTNVNAMVAPATEDLKGIVWGVAGRIVGQQWPMVPQTSPMQYWVPVGFGAVMLLTMLVRLVLSARNVWRWRRYPSAGSVQGRAGAWRVGFPLLINAVPVAFFLLVLPRFVPGSLANLEFGQPDSSGYMP